MDGVKTDFVEGKATFLVLRVTARSCEPTVLLAAAYIQKSGKENIPERQQALARDNFQVFMGFQGAALCPCVIEFVSHSAQIMQTLAFSLTWKGLSLV